MRRGLSSIEAVALVCVFLFSAAAHAESPEDSLLLYAVAIRRTPLPDWGSGAGIYLGQGLVITAAHVVGRSFLTRPKIVIADSEFGATAIKEGSFEETDLTLLSFDDRGLPLRYRLRRASICRQDPTPGEQVVTVAPGRLAHSHVISPNILPPNARKFSTVIADVAETGNSGSGVFDLERKCLLGIMSRKISAYMKDGTAVGPHLRDIAKYFVPASTIARFIPNEYKVQ
jgi:S1-C subfamily serine protease